MKKSKIALVLLSTFFVLQSKGKSVSYADTLKGGEIQTFEVDSFKYKIGFKFISEQNGDHSVEPYSYQVYNKGVQVITPINNSSFSIETGLYMITKVSDNNYTIKTHSYIGMPSFLYYGIESDPIMMYNKNISIPFNCRFDGSVIYCSAGLMVDYLISKELAKNRVAVDSINFNQYDDRKLNWGYNLSVGGERSFNKKLSFFAEVRFAQTLSSSKTSTGNFFFYPSYLSWGIAIGVNYKFYKHCR